MHPKKTLEELVCATDGGVFVVFAEVVRVTHGKSIGVFVLFDSDMSYLMEKSCSFFVAQSKVFEICSWICEFIRSIAMVYGDNF
jgi:hypothetical protein